MRVIFNRYLVLVAGIYLMSISGSIYLFSVYAEGLQTQLGYTATETALVGTLANVGAWVAVLGGLFYDNFGPRLTTIGSVLMISIGYLMMYLAYNKVFWSNNIIVGVCAMIMGQGSSWSYTVALNTNVQNFSLKDRGKIVGVLVCFFGLSAGVYTEVFRAFFAPDTGEFLLFMGVFFSVVSLIFGFVSNVVDRKQETENFRIYSAYGLGIFIAFYLAAANLIQNFVTIREEYFGVPLAFMMFWFIFIAVFSPTEPLIEFFTKDHDIIEESDAEGFLDITLKNKFLEINNFNLWQALRTIPFWLLFIIMFGTIGSAIVTVNNMTKLVISRDEFSPSVHEIALVDIPHYKDINTFVVLFSVCNTIGRMFVGAMSDYLIDKFDRTSFMIVCVMIMSTSQIYMVFASVEMIYFGIVLIGLAYGGIFCLVPIQVSERFGVKNFGGNWGFVGTAPSMGSLLFSTFVSGKFLEMYQEKNKICILTDNVCNYQCVGHECFSYTYYITFGTCLVCLVAAILLKLHTVHQERKKDATLYVQVQE